MVTTYGLNVKAKILEIQKLDDSIEQRAMVNTCGLHIYIYNIDFHFGMGLPKQYQFLCRNFRIGSICHLEISRIWFRTFCLRNFIQFGIIFYDNNSALKTLFFLADNFRIAEYKYMGQIEIYDDASSPNSR